MKGLGSVVDEEDEEFSFRFLEDESEFFGAEDARGRFTGAIFVVGSDVIAMEIEDLVFGRRLEVKRFLGKEKKSSRVCRGYFRRNVLPGCNYNNLNTFYRTGSLTPAIIPHNLAK